MVNDLVARLGDLPQIEQKNMRNFQRESGHSTDYLAELAEAYGTEAIDIIETSRDTGKPIHTVTMYIDEGYTTEQATKLINVKEQWEQAPSDNFKDWVSRENIMYVDDLLGKHATEDELNGFLEQAQALSHRSGVGVGQTLHQMREMEKANPSLRRQHTPRTLLMYATGRVPEEPWNSHYNAE